MNEAGQIVGSSYFYFVSNFASVCNLGITEHPVSFPGPVDLGAIAALQASSECFQCYAQAISSNGIVVGNVHAEAFIDSGGNISYLGFLPSGGAYSSASGVNASGHVVGYASAGPGLNYHAFFYSNGQMSDINPAGARDPGNSFATGINDSDQIAGYSEDPDYGNAKAFLYATGSYTYIGRGVGGTSIAYGINATGQVVGSYSDPALFTGGHAFMYSGGVMTDLNTEIAPSDPLAGQIVLTTAIHVADNGIVLASGSPADSTAGKKHYYVLSPVNAQNSLAKYLNVDPIPNASGKGTMGADLTVLTLTLPQALAVGGYDHFNWLQTITGFAYNGAAFDCISIALIFGRCVGVDPLLGGNSVAEPADNYKEYWDEVPIVLRSEYYYANHPVSFDDAPNLIDPGWTAYFQTQLVGVRSDHSYDVLSDRFGKPSLDFRWKYTQTNLFSGGLTTVLANIDPALAGGGDVVFLGYGTAADPVTGPINDGDLNGDGVINCGDLELIKLAFGKVAGQVGYDVRADVNEDGVVNILDLSEEARLMPAGTVCH